MRKLIICIITNCEVLEKTNGRIKAHKIKSLIRSLKEYVSTEA